MSNGALPETESLWNKVKGFFKTQTEHTAAALLLNAPNIARSVLGAWFGYVKKDTDKRWANMLNWFKGMKWIDDETAKELYKLKDLPNFGDVFAYYGIFLMLTVQHVSGWSDVISADVKRNLNTQHRPTDVSPESIMAASFLAPEKTAEIRKIIAQTGIPEAQIDLMFLSMQRVHDITTIRTLYLWKLIDDNTMSKYMKQLGYTAERINEIVETWEIIPPISDIITMAVREAFTPEIAEKFGQYEDFPPAVSEWGAKQGLNAEWSKRYWAAHWVLPSPLQGMEMLHRGIISREEFELLLRALDVMPFWRKKLTEMSYNVLTRVDVRRMHAMGVILDDDLVKAYKDGGYNDDDAALMAEFTIQYNANTDKDLVKSEVLNGYKEGAINRTAALAALQSLKYSDTIANYLLDFADYQKDKELETLEINNIQKRFEDNLITESDATNRLNQLGLSQKRIALLIEKWYINKFEDIKKLSKAELAALFKAGLIQKSNYEEGLYILGYSDKDAKLLTQLLTMPAKTK